MDKTPIEKTALVDLVKEATLLEKDIDLKIMKYNEAVALKPVIDKEVDRYNLIIGEIVRRFPFLANDPEFEQRKLNDDKENGGFKLLWKEN